MEIVLIKKTSTGNIVELGPTESLFDEISCYKGGKSTIIFGFRQKNDYSVLKDVCLAFYGVLNKGSNNEKKLIFTRESSINSFVFIKYPKNDKRIKLVLSSVQNVEFIPDSVGDFLLTEEWSGKDDLLFKLTCEVEPNLTETLAEDINLIIDFDLHLL